MINKKSKKPIQKQRKPIQNINTRNNGQNKQYNRNNNSKTRKTKSNSNTKKRPVRQTTNRTKQYNVNPNQRNNDIRMRSRTSTGSKPKRQTKRTDKARQRRVPPQKRPQQMNMGQRTYQQRPAQPRRKRRMTKREYLLRKRRRRIFYNMLSCIMILGLVTGFTASKIKEYNETPRAGYSAIAQSVAKKSKVWPSLIIKDEEVVTVDSAAGLFKKIKDEGSEVNASDLVCITAKSEELFEQNEEKLLADTQMFLLENRHSNFSYYLDELNRLDKHNYSIMQEFYSIEDKAAAASLLKYKLNNNIQLKTSIFLKQKSDLTKELVQERSFIVSEMSENQQQHLAPVKGIVSYKIDGLEEELVNAIKDEISYTEYNKYMKAVAKDITMEPVQPLKNTPLFKIIKSNKWVAITYVEFLNSSDLEINKTYSLYAEEVPGKLFEVTLTSIQDVGNGMLRLVLTGDDTEVLKYRALTFTDRVESEIGLEIPSSSILKKNLLKIDENFVNEDENGTFVIVKKEGIVNNHKIEVVCRADGFVYTNLKDIPISTELVTIDKSKSITVTEIEEVNFILLKGKEDTPIRVEILENTPLITIIKTNEAITKKDKVVTNPEYFNS